MHGRDGDIPESLRGLLELQHDDVAFARLMREVELNEGDTRGDVKHVLFMVSYQRASDSIRFSLTCAGSIEALVDVVERTSSVLTAREAELQTLRELSAEMRTALAGVNEVDLDPASPIDSPLSPADQRRFQLMSSVDDRLTPTQSGTATPVAPPTPRSPLPMSRTLTFEDTPPPRTRASSASGRLLPPIRTRFLARGA